MSIGQVLQQLRDEFPDVSISKIRFLEAEGLIEPERATSGYRKFSASDLERLRYILGAQRDHYLPLRVIAQHLEAMERGLEPPMDGGPPRVPESAGAVGQPNEDSPGGWATTPELRISADELVESSGLTHEQLTELRSFGLVSPRPGTDYYDADALVVATTVSRFAGYGLEPRHLRVFKSAADRQIGLVEQVVKPMARQHDDTSKARVGEMVAELTTLSLRLHTALVRGGLLAMDLTGRWVLLPMSVACLFTGFVQSFGTEWGVLRHYWVVATLVINVVATVVLVLFLGALGDLADQARVAGSDAQVLELRDPSPVVHAVAALVVLVLATALSVVKPRGRTRRGQRLLRTSRTAAG